MLIYCLLFILVITQALSFYFIFNKIKPIIPIKGILLKPIPDQIKFEDVDKDNKLVRDVLETIRIEGWVVEVKEDVGIMRSYDVNFTSHDGNVHFTNKIGLGFNDKMEPYLRICSIRSPEASISINKDFSLLSNDILVFLWDYIIKYHEDKNMDRTNSYLKDMKAIGSRLKTLNRIRKLDEIL